MIGHEVFAGYRLEERIGVGGMAEVFRASRLGPGGFAKQVALKRVLPDLARDPRFVAMFLEEARLAAQLTAPGLVQVFDFGQADGGYFLVMEYVEGADLGALLAGLGRLPPALVVYVGRQLCAALAELHQARDAGSGEPLGVVHRDVSPGNILLSVGGDVKLGDFGVAKARARSVRTERGSLKGKLAYMSPEQVRGDEVDGRADVYGLGIVLHEALTGERYLTARDGGGEAELLRAAERPVFRAPSSLCPGVPAALDAALARALATEPQRRFPNATFFEEALAACAPGLDLSASRRELGVLVRAARPPTAPAAAAGTRAGEGGGATASGATTEGATANGATVSDAGPTRSVGDHGSTLGARDAGSARSVGDHDSTLRARGAGPARSVGDHGSARSEGDRDAARSAGDRAGADAGHRPTRAEAPGRPADGHRTEVLTNAIGPSRRAGPGGARARWLWLPIAATVVAGAALVSGRAGVWTALRSSTVEPAPRGRFSPGAPVAIVAETTPSASPEAGARPSRGTEGRALGESAAVAPPAEAGAIASRTRPRARPRGIPDAAEERAFPPTPRPTPALRPTPSPGAVSLAAPEPAVAATARAAELVPVPTPAPTLALGDARGALDDIARMLERRGVLRADAPELYRALSALAARAAEPGVSAVELERLRAQAAGLATDRAFIDAKLQRLDRELANRELPIDVRQELRRHSRQALSDSVSGRYDEANRELNEIARIVER